MPPGLGRRSTVLRFCVCLCATPATPQFLDGPYKTFLASVRLEKAYRKISEGQPFGEDGEGGAQQHATDEQLGGPGQGGNGQHRQPAVQLQAKQQHNHVHVVVLPA